MGLILCRPKLLTPAQEETFLRRSVDINPANEQERRVFERTPIGRRGGPRRLAVVIGRKWPETGVQLSVQFLDNPPRDLRTRILKHMNAWSKTANVRFDETNETGEVRIARLDAPEDMAGYWSYVGTEISAIDKDQPTLNLEGFTMKTSEAEFKRVVRHEAGHTLGFDHEHMREELVKRIDRRKAFAYFDRTQGWSEEETTEQVLTPLVRSSIMGTSEADPLSIMCYQIPAAITKNGKSIPGGKDINPKDFAFAGKIYPKPAPRDATTAPAAAPAAAAKVTVAVPAEATPASEVTVTVPAGAAPTAAADVTVTVPAADLGSAAQGDTFHIVIFDRFAPDAEGGKALPKNPKFLRVYASYAGARVTVPMRVRSDKGEPPTEFGNIIATHERIRNYTNRESGSLPSDEDMVRFGGQLFETIFQGDVRRLYDEARSRQHGKRLNFIFTSMVPWIAEKPWEFAYDISRQSFLATEDVHFVRNVLTAIPADMIPPRRGPLRILVASAQPIGFGQLSIQQEEEVIRRGFDSLIKAGLVEVVPLARATPTSIHTALSLGDFSVVHFIGHGAFDDETQEGSLVFENARGGEARLGERSVREIFCQRGIRLIFLNACQTGAGGRADFNKGIAQSLVAHGLPALVANQYSVLDISATHFARHFYWALANGFSVGEAAREARIAVNYSLEGDIIDWAVPVVYARDPDMKLCARPEGVAATMAAERATRRATADGRAVKIAVWDIDSIFPSLGKTLERINGAQNRISFELVDLSAPIDAWDLEKRARDGTPYLWAERLAQRLGRLPLELHVNVLACVTRHWLRSDNDYDIYSWWPEEGGPPVLIFSVAGFDDLVPDDMLTDRAVANALVEALAGYLGQVDAHKGGSKDCPMAYNADRSIAHITGLLTFDAECKRKLAKRIPKELPALEAILKAFR